MKNKYIRCTSYEGIDCHALNDLKGLGFDFLLQDY